MFNLPTYVANTPEIQPFLKNADHIDVKEIDGEIDMRSFIANCFGYMPGWMRFLYRIRWVFVRLLGMTQEGIPQPGTPDPEKVSFTPGEKQAFFTVQAAEENRFWLAGATEPHLTANLGIVREPLSETRSRYYLLTIVHYHKWTGPLYFNVIRPFHHIAVNRMMVAGIAAR
ncbi:MAG: DUF2867 domain-containing protein [Chloroflexota bacterium]